MTLIHFITNIYHNGLKFLTQILFRLCSVNRVSKRKIQTDLIKSKKSSSSKKTPQIKPNITFLKLEKIGHFSPEYKYGGAIVGIDNAIYAIPSGASHVLKIDPKTNELRKLGALPKSPFKWTNGCPYSDGNIYGFTRLSNNLLKINPEQQSVEEISIGLKYSDEHHYSGVLYKNIIYQPPRRNNTILSINLDTKHVSEIKLSRLSLKSGFTASILHPNGLIYCLPENWGRVMVFNPNSKKYAFIGPVLRCIVYCPTIGYDGLIYGFGGNKGIIQIDPYNNTVRIIFKNIYFGSSNTISGKNGLLYNVIGSGNSFYEFNPKTKTLNKIAETDEIPSWKCSGAVICDNNIWCTPAYGKYIYKLEFREMNK